MSTLSQRISEKRGAESVAGKHAPGAKLDEEALAARFKVPGSPGRDAPGQLAAILKGDGEAAEHAMRGHTASAAMNALEYFRQRVYKNGRLYTGLRYDTGSPIAQRKKKPT